MYIYFNIHIHVYIYVYIYPPSHTERPTHTCN